MRSGRATVIANIVTWPAVGESHQKLKRDFEKTIKISVPDNEKWE